MGNQRLIQLTLWDNPNAKLNSQYGQGITYEEWLKKEEERLDAQGRTTEIRSRTVGKNSKGGNKKEIALFVNPVEKSVGLPKRQILG